MLEAIQANLMEIMMTVLTAVATAIGIAIKNAYTRYMDTKTKKEIVNATVQYVEQISKTLEMTSEEKFAKAKEKALEWLKERGIKISDTELEILIESEVRGFKDVARVADPPQQ